LSLSSVRDLQYLQLNTPVPQVHTSDRPPEEPPARHQLVWSERPLENAVAALSDPSCRCMVDRRLAPLVVFSIFTTRCPQFVFGLCSLTYLYLALLCRTTVYRDLFVNISSCSKKNQSERLCSSFFPFGFWQNQQLEVSFINIFIIRT
jgi:hypothetical protein